MALHRSLVMEKQTVDSFEVNTIYMMTQAFELIIRDIERRLQKASTPFRHEKRQQFNRLMKSIKDIYTQFDILYQDIIDSTEGRGWETLDIWAEESNELARLILLYADKSAGNMDNISKIFRYLRRFKGQGIVTEEVLSKFYLKK